MDTNRHEFSGASHPRPHLAYVFERFPSFTQTFTVREILELERQGVRIALFSIHDTRDELPRNFPDELYDRVTFLPPEKELVEEVKRLKADDQFSNEIVLTLREWKDRPDGRDKQRVYEAAWIGLKLRELGIRHVHSHFAGVGARTCWWLRKFYGITYSFTGHANDVFCTHDLPLTLDQLMRDASLVVTVSDYTVRYLEGEFPHANRKIKRIYNGLDLAPFNAVADQRDETAIWNAERKLIFTVGRLIEKKGFDDLITACATLQKQGRTDFRCVIAGDGPLEEELQSQIDREGLSEVVELVGPKSQNEIRSYLSEAAIFALPCVTESDGGKDNLPTVIMEAMGAGVPCASTILAGVPEMIVDGETGRLVPERKPEAFAGILADLLDDPASSQNMGAAGRERAGRLFAKEVTANQLADELIAHGLVRWDLSLGHFMSFLKQTVVLTRETFS